MLMCIVKSRSLCLLEKGESRELMTCMAVWRIKKLDGEIEFSQESIDRVIGWIIQRESYANDCRTNE